MRSRKPPNALHADKDSVETALSPDVARPEETRPGSAAPPPRGIRLKALGNVRELALALVVIIAFVGLALLNNRFFTEDNLAVTAVGFAPLLIVSIGMTIALISGGFDLSVGGVVALTAVCLIYC